MATIPPEPACGNCRFSRSEEIEGATFLLCRRWAPRVMVPEVEGTTSHPFAWWPAVNSTDWCGEYQPQPAVEIAAPATGTALAIAA